ncbi:MAG TPA: phospholipase D-like domain-containing protein, partial [Caldilineaceae bacterium]|nr:phospholipase D-like domain-containing protein [Caldilineaceae bacterium]
TTLELPTEPGPFVQITRTIPPRSCYASAHVPTAKRFVGDEGELGSLRTYLDLLRRARKYIVINDQYLFSPEITKALHEALLNDDGPEFVVILLPKNIAESPTVDPLFFKWRRRAFHVLFYGADTDPITADEPASLTMTRTYTVNASGSSYVRYKVILLTSVNDQGDEIYVHAKQIIVDDVVMSIGSANFTLRGSTYEMEINASVAGRKLVKGGTDLVREQRIEVCRRMLGLPLAYATLLQDWYAAGKFFKQGGFLSWLRPVFWGCAAGPTEASGAMPNRRTHPLFNTQ